MPIEAERGVTSNWNYPLSVPTASALPTSAPIGAIVRIEDSGAAAQWTGSAFVPLGGGTSQIVNPAPDASTTFTFGVPLPGQVGLQDGGSIGIYSQISADRTYSFGLSPLGNSGARLDIVNNSPSFLTLLLPSGSDFITYLQPFSSVEFLILGGAYRILSRPLTQRGRATLVNGLSPFKL